MGACGLYRTILPHLAPGMYHNNPWVPVKLTDAPDVVAGDHDALRRLLADSGNDDLFGDGFVEYGFMQPAWIRDVIANAEDPYDAASVREGAATASGPRRPLSVSPWACDGSVDPTVSSCGTGTFTTVVSEDLELLLVGDLPIDLSPLE